MAAGSAALSSSTAFTAPEISISVPSKYSVPFTPTCAPLTKAEPETTFSPPVMAASASAGAVMLSVPPSTFTVPSTVPPFSVRLSVASILPVMLCPFMWMVVAA